MSTYAVGKAPPADRRAARRIPYLCEVRFDGVQTGAANVRISDLSATGAFIDSIATFPVGAILHLRFSIGTREVCVAGEVRHTLPQIGMGVRFLDIGPSEEAIIKNIVSEKAS